MELSCNSFTEKTYTRPKHIEELQTIVKSFISVKNPRAHCSSKMLDYLNITNQHEPHQSAYRPLDSTETTLLRVSNDILMALD